MTRLTALAHEKLSCIAHLAVFDAQQPSWLPAYIGAASSIYVTADSVSMLADAMATDKPVIALSDKGAIENPRIADFLTCQTEKKHITLVNVSDALTNTIVDYRAQQSAARPTWSKIFLQDLSARHIDVNPSTAQKSDEVVRILGIGDCNTGGVNEAPTDNLPNMLASVLRAQGKKAQVINLGKAMTTTREGVAFARKNTQKTDIVLINFGLLDSWWVVLPTWYVPYYPDNIFKKIARKMLKSLKKRLRKPFVRRFCRWVMWFLWMNTVAI